MSSQPVFWFLVFFLKCFWGQSLNYGFFCITDFPHVVAKTATGNLGLNLGLSAHYLRKKNWLFVDGFRFLIDLASAKFPSRIQPRFSSMLIGQACVIASHLRPGINLDILETQTESWSRFSVQEKNIFSTFFLCDYHNNPMKNHGQNFQERQVRKLETSKSQRPTGVNVFLTFLNLALCLQRLLYNYNNLNFLSVNLMSKVNMVCMIVACIK